MATKVPIYRFSPNRTDPRVLEAITVQRHRLAQIAFDRLKSSVLTGDKHHLLFVGPRGSGKSHLITILAHRLANDPALTNRLRIARLPEDKSSPRFSTLLILIIESLRRQYPSEFREPPLGRLRPLEEDRRCQVLSDQLLRDLGDRTLLVVVENLDETMRHLGEEGQNRWRSFLQEHPVTATLATAQQITPYLSNRDWLFFGFFVIDRLAPLRADDAVELLRKIAELNQDSELAAYLQSPEGRGRVLVLVHLSGGNQRVFITLAEFVSRRELEDLVSAFEKLVDELTPYYQERLRWLDTVLTERETIEYLCRRRNPATPDEVGHDLLKTDDEAQASLSALVDKGYLTRLGEGRSARYELAEPLMRICVEVKDPHAEPIRLIIEFLRLWFDQQTCVELLAGIPHDHQRERRYVEAAIREHQSGIDHPIFAELESQLKELEGDTQKWIETLAGLAEMRGTAADWRNYAYAMKKSGDLAGALVAAEKGVTKDSDSSYAHLLCGSVLREMGRYAEAMEAFDRAIAIDPEYTFAICYKGFVLAKMGRFTEAVEALDRAIAIDPEFKFAWNIKGNRFAELGRYAEAIEFYDRAIAIDPEDMFAWYYKGKALANTGHYKEAIKFYDQAIALDPKYRFVWNNKGHALSRIGRHAEALVMCDQVLALDPTDTDAMEIRAEAHAAMGDWVEAVRWFRERLSLLGAENRTQKWESSEQDLIVAALRSPGGPVVWAERVGDLVTVAREADALPYLGSGLVGSLNFVPDSLIGTPELTEWLNVWRKACQGEPAMELPLRLYETGLQYLVKRDANELNTLPREERAVLRDLFRLPSEV